MICVALAMAAPATAAQPSIVTGEVVDGSGVPLPYSTVSLVDESEGAVADGEGRFSFHTRSVGPQTVEARLLGYEPARARVTLSPGDTVRVRLVLWATLLELGEAVVSADAFVAGADEVRGLSPLDVVTTPGAAADLFRAVQTFPGLVEVDDGAGLFVRGGDVGETVVLLDGARLLQPYKFESPLGGVFGTVSPFLVAGTRFSTGGFSARYGNALSAVLALDSQDEPSSPARAASLSLAAASVSLDQPLGKVFADGLIGEGGLRVAANRSFTDVLFWVNGREEEFETTPRSIDGSASLTVPYGAAGRVKLLALATHDRLGVRVEEPSFIGVYRGSSASGLGLVEWSDLAGSWFLRASASYARYGAHQHLGALDLRPADEAARLRLDAEREAGDRVRFLTGFEAERLRTTYRGTIPLGDVYDPAVETFTLDESLGAAHGAAWGEVEAQVGRRLVLTAGLRADGHTLARQVALDPRLSAQVALATGTRLRLAWGLYSQFPDLATYAVDQSEDGRPLSTQRAQHLVVGLLHERGPLTLRTEAYVKTYRDLAVDTGGEVWRNAGRGVARGLDLFARYGAVGEGRFSGWVSYTLLHARRTQTRHLGAETVLEEGPPPFGTTHTLTVVGKAALWHRLSGAVRFRLAGGRPYTPVVDAAPSGEGFFLPVEGPVGSERLPTFARLDLQASYLFRIGRWGTLITFAAFNNALDHANVVGYTYSADYAERTPEVSPFRRSVYAGVTLAF
jgi:hypothetical protein